MSAYVAPDALEAYQCPTLFHYLPSLYRRRIAVGGVRTQRDPMRASIVSGDSCSAWRDSALGGAAPAVTQIVDCHADRTIRRESGFGLKMCRIGSAASEPAKFVVVCAADSVWLPTGFRVTVPVNRRATTVRRGCACTRRRYAIWCVANCTKKVTTRVRRCPV